MKDFFKKLVISYLFFWARIVLAERRPRVVGVTGSVGKTTTKEAIAAVLTHPKAFPKVGLVSKASGNLNTEFGLPLAILGYVKAPTGLLSWLGLLAIVPLRALGFVTVADYPNVLVLEYAADQPGDITRLVGLAIPTIACVTAIGPAHLERFETIGRVGEEKGQLVRAVSPRGLVILAKDNQKTAALKRLSRAKTVLVAGRGVELSKGIAQAVGSFFQLPKSVSSEALKHFVSLHGRLETIRVGTFTVFDDTYNANPLSMELALDTLAETTPKKRRRVAILGEMLELGTAGPDYHRKVGKIARAQADLVIGVGELARNFAGEHWFPTSTATADEILQFLKPHDFILVKGSRGVMMEKVVEALRQGWKETHG